MGCVRFENEEQITLHIATLHSTHSHTHTHMHERTHIHTRAHTHTHTHARERGGEEERVNICQRLIKSDDVVPAAAAKRLIPTVSRDGVT